MADSYSQAQIASYTADGTYTVPAGVRVVLANIIVGSKTSASAGTRTCIVSVNAVPVLRFSTTQTSTWVALSTKGGTGIPAANGTGSIDVSNIVLEEGDTIDVDFTSIIGDTKEAIICGAEIQLS